MDGYTDVFFINISQNIDMGLIMNKWNLDFFFHVADQDRLGETVGHKYMLYPLDTIGIYWHWL